MAERRALITGVTGQDGPYLAAFLIGKGYVVHGLRRPSTVPADPSLARLAQTGAFHLHTGDLADGAGLARLLAMLRPTEVYNLAAQSHVGASFDVPVATVDINATGPLRLLEAIRQAGLDRHARLYQASSSEMFGRTDTQPQSEATPFRPVSPYGAAKLQAHWLTATYRRAYGLFACCGILFNHESPRRRDAFVTRKITRGVAALARGGGGPLVLGNLDARRDWGHARDYVAGMWAMLQADRPDDVILATGQDRSVRAFATAAFARAGRAVDWRGRGADEVGVDADTGQVLVRVDPGLFRPTEIDCLCGDAAKARRTLGWAPHTRFEDLVAEMVDADLDALDGQHVLPPTPGA